MTLRDYLELERRRHSLVTRGVETNPAVHQPWPKLSCTTVNQFTRLENSKFFRIYFGKLFKILYFPEKCFVFILANFLKIGIFLRKTLKKSVFPVFFWNLFWKTLLKSCFPDFFSHLFWKTFLKNVFPDLFPKWFLKTSKK